MRAKRGKAHLCCSSRQLTQLSVGKLTLTFPPPQVRVLASGRLPIGSLAVCRLVSLKGEKCANQSVFRRPRQQRDWIEMDLSNQMAAQKPHKDALKV